MKKTITILVALMLSVAGGYFYVRYDEHMTEVAQDSLDWPSVSGLVTRSRLVAARSGIGSKNRVTYRIDIRYEYIVGDQMFENDVVQFNQGNLSTVGKERLVSSYPEGRKVEVFYNPQKPKQSVLVRGSYP